MVQRNAGQVYGWQTIDAIIRYRSSTSTCSVATHHLEHGVVPLVGDSGMQEATTHAPSALATRVEPANGFSLRLFGTFFVPVSYFSFFKLLSFLQFDLVLLFALKDL